MKIENDVLYINNEPFYPRYTEVETYTVFLGKSKRSKIAKQSQIKEEVKLDNQDRGIDRS
jgi:hypothetical protein